MNIVELSLIAIGLAMDAFAVAICSGLSMQKRSLKKAFIIGLYFGGFQALMPLAGYLLGSQFADNISSFDHWIAFILLAIVGGNMVKESFEKEEECCCNKTEISLGLKTMLPLAVATSIDALAAGISFAFLQVHIISAVSLIGIITMVLSMLGVKIGYAFGEKFKQRAELAGGVILILLGIKILLEHTGVLPL